MSEKNADEITKQIVPTVITYYNEDKTVKERVRTRVPLDEAAHTALPAFKKHVASFAGIREHTVALGMGSYDIKLFRIVKSSNYEIQTQGQWDMERPSFVEADLTSGTSELNGKI